MAAASPQITAKQILDKVFEAVTLVFRFIGMIVGWVILLIIAATVARTQGWAFPAIRTMDPTPLAYLCGAWWLLKKAG